MRIFQKSCNKKTFPSVIKARAFFRACQTRTRYQQKGQAVLLVMVMMVSMGGFGAVAANPIVAVPSNNVEIIREDVPASAAINDLAFDISASSSKTPKQALSRAVTWNVWGWGEWRNSDNRVRPCGSSEHKNGSTILETYHYTRTYLAWSSISTDYRGDSGRIWGNYTVIPQSCLMKGRLLIILWLFIMT